jgi:hypothetical protein
MTLLSRRILRPSFLGTSQDEQAGLPPLVAAPRAPDARVTVLGLAWLGIVLVSGCNNATPAKTVVKAAPPQVVERVEPAVLPRVRFVEVTKPAGLTFEHCNGMTGAKLLPETMGSGVAFLDYDGDGDQDLLLVNSCPWPGEEARFENPKPTQALYQNDGKGQFKDVTKDSALDLPLFGMGVAVGDYDNDGDPDLLLTAIGGCRLFRNEGAGKFTDVTETAKAKGSSNWPTSAAFFDIENDGDLDLFICEYVSWSAKYDAAQAFNLVGGGRAYGPPTAFPGAYCTLLRNDAGVFTDTSEEAGIRVHTPDSKAPLAKALGVAPCDIDGDGLVDLAIANDTVPNFLFHNKGGGKFEEIGIISGVAFDQAGSPRGAMGVDWGDFRNDGSLALAVANFANEMIALYVTDEPASLQFSDLAPYFGLGSATQPPLKFGLFFFDYDLDGRVDLLVANGHLENEISKVQASESYEQPAQLYWNSGQGEQRLFLQVGPDVAGPDLFQPMVGRGSAYADIDGDGDLDVCLTASGGSARLFRNDGGNENHWIRLKLVGTKSNRDAIGANVKVTASVVTQTRQLFPAKSYLSSVELPLTFGLGKADKVDSIEIRWPSGEITQLESLAVDRLHTIREQE